MMATQTGEIVLTLIRKALDEGAEVNCDVFQGADWMQTIDFATNQGVLGVCFDSVEQLSETQRPDLDNLMEWLGQVEYQTTLYEE